MKNLPETIETVEELEEVLSRPSDALVEFMADLDGDVMILGAGGKVGPTMARTAKRAIETAGVKKQVIAVDVAPLDQLRAEGIETIACDLLETGAAEKLPKVENVIYMIGRKFGSTGSESLTWAVNVIAACNAARAFTGSRVVAFSTGCVYPVMDITTCGATEETPLDPVGEYAMSCLGRERMFDHFSETAGERVLHFRLNYAVELRYGVLVDVATKVFNDEAVDVTTGFANVLWQGDVCNAALRSLAFAASPAKALNVTGPETFSIRWAAERFARLFDKTATFSGQENGRAYLSNAAQAGRLLGHPSVPVQQIIDWIAHWMKTGGQSSGKPTHFETQDGKY
ncbi:MAG: NAD(P)-dependent oxidoreductase [Planctomycetes bacterium]|nr:NAD(P)-dependent oxidoreductase [Planctomycetota bacterium]